MKQLRFITLVAATTIAGGLPQPAESGAFTSADNASFPINLVKHPRGYVGNGGVLTNEVCLVNTNLPAGANVSDIEDSIRKVVNTVNRNRGVTGNLGLFGNNDIGGSQVDYESTLLHEIGHCVGLAHPNLATESGLAGDVRNATKARVGTNGSFDTTIGADGNYGSNDDVRGDDQNVYWWVAAGTNDPLELPDPIGGATLTQSTAAADLPGTQTWVANADRDVLAALGYSNTESAMQQGAFFDEAQRRFTNEDVRALRFGMTGLDRVEGTADDYTLELEYGGQVSSASCDINITFGTSFAFCSSGSSAISGTSGQHRRITSALVSMSQTINWYYSTAANTTTAINSVLPSPAVGSPSTVSITVSSSGAISGTPSGDFEIFFAGDSCVGTLSSGTGSCQVTPVDDGTQTVLAEYLGDQGFDASDTQADFVVAGLPTPTVTITDSTPNPSTVGAGYTVSVSVTSGSGSPTGAVTISDGTDDCTTGNLSGGAASCVLTSTTAGGKILTATYPGDASFNSAQGTAGHTVNPATPSVLITGDTPDPSALSSAYTVSVSVSGAGATPTGSVTVDDGAANCAITLASGAGSCDLTSTTAGAKTLTASYAGDANYSSSSDTEAHTVSQATPTVTITSDDPDPSPVGAPYTVEVSVTSPAGTPTGTITISDGTDDCTTGALSGGSASCTLTSTTAGAKTLTASYAGDANYTSGSDTEAHTVSQATPTVTITSDDPDPSPVGAAYTVEVSVTSPAGTPTGTVTISDGTDDCTTGALTGGSASCALTSTTGGSKTLTATYSGDANFTTAQGTTDHTVALANPVVNIVGDTPDPSELGAAYTVSATVSGAGATPTGSVTIGDGTDSCVATLAGGSGNCALTSTTAGAKTLTANYSGDGNYATGSDTDSHVVNQGTPTVLITGDTPDPSQVGSPITVSATVTGLGTTPTGSITVDDGDANCVITLSGGAGSCLLIPMTAGDKTLTANYGGDANYATGSDTEAHTVDKITPSVTITDDTPDPSEVGQAYNVTVTVGSLIGTPSGTVTISDGLDDCTTPALAGGTASCDLTSTTAGAKTLTASYAGDANFNAAEGTADHQVDRAPATVTVTGTSPAPALGTAYTVSATVTGSFVDATGTVTISDGLDECTTPALSAGSASCQLTSTTAGDKTLTATYSGDSNYATAQGTTSQTVAVGSSVVTITSDTPDPSPVGDSYTVAVSVSGNGVAPSGTVDVGDGESSCQITLAAGAGSCSLAGQSAGAKTLTASYSGDANYASDDDNETHTVTEGSSVTNLLSATPSPAALGAGYTVEVAVSGGGETPTGAVTVDDGADNCVATLSAGAGSCVLTSTTAGSKTLTANYPGDGNYSASSDTLAHTVTVAVPTVTIDSSSPNPSELGATFTVSVSVSSGVGLPSGTVTISDGEVQCVTPALSAGSASCDLASVSAGDKTLTATYSGDANFASAQDTASHTVERAIPDIAITDSSPNPSSINQGFTVVVTVTSSVGSPSGQVTVSDGLASCVTAPLASGMASCVLVSTSAGDKTLTASYAGDANFMAAQGTAAHTVNTGPLPEEIFSDGFESP